MKTLITKSPGPNPTLVCEEYVTLCVLHQTRNNRQLDTPSVANNVE